MADYIDMSKTDSYINPRKIVRIALLFDHFRAGYKYRKAGITKAKWFGLVPAQKYCASCIKLDYMGDFKVVSREEATYDGTYLRIWLDPKNANKWYCGTDIKFATVEKANLYYKMVKGL